MRLSTLAAVSLLLPFHSIGADPILSSAEVNVVGHVITNSADSLVIESEGRRISISTDRATKYERAGRAVSRKDATPGSGVSVLGRETAPGTIAASRIVIAASPPANKSFVPRTTTGGVTNVPRR